jgi:hypothetical protein
MQSFTRLFVFWAPVTIVGTLILATWQSLVVASAVGCCWYFLQFLLALWWPNLTFERWAYLLRDEDLIIHRGVLLRTVTAIPINRIQHVDMRQGPFEQLLGLALIQVHTASGVGSDGVVPGLDLQDAEALRDRLVEVSGEDGV